MKNPAVVIESFMDQLGSCYTEMNKKPYEYCPGVFLYPSEIHTVEYIANISTTNLSDIAHQMNLTRGAVSKMVVKLEQLGLVKRYKYLHNQKEVYLHLTELGVAAYEGHKAYHASMRQSLKAYLDSISEDERDAIIRFLSLYNREMQKLSKKYDDQ